MSANKIQSVLETTFVSAISKLTAADSVGYYSDLYVQADPETGEVQIYDEEERLLDKVVVFNWVGSTGKEQQFYRRVTDTLKVVLSQLVEKKAFEDSHIMRPFSVSLTDDSFTVIEELLFIDDDLLRLDDPLLKNLDAELEEFLENLLSDVK